MTWNQSTGGAVPPFGRTMWSGRGGCAFRWRPLEIAAMVLGFAIWWPIGLAVLAVKVAQRRGYRLEDAMEAMRSGFGRGSGQGGAPRGRWQPFASPTGNAAFDDWKEAELARLDEERRKLDAAQREFSEHLDNLRRARDREEFDSFMRARDANRPQS